MTEYENSEALLIFDGDCGFCLYCVNKAQQFGVSCPVKPYQSLDLNSYGLTTQQCSQSVQLVEYGETFRRNYHGAEAIGMLLKNYSRKKMVRGTGVILLNPVILPMSEFLYKRVAKNRNKIRIKGKPSCMISS
jgi:predicted DCC family thiol-disulfide oxidoreductase YuxK